MRTLPSYLLSKQASGTFRPLDADAAGGSLRADGWRTLCARLNAIPWDARAAGEAKHYRASRSDRTFWMAHERSSDFRYTS